MADNTVLNTMTGGDTISTDDIAGVKVQRVKVQYGGDGAATDVDTGTPLPVTISGVATSAKQDTGNTSIASVDTKTPALGQALAASSVPVVLTAAQITTLTPPAAITGFATSAKQDNLLTELQLKADLSETQPVSLASVPSHAVTNAGTFAVQAAESDGANVTLGAKADAKSTATDTTAVSAMSVLKQISASVQAPPSQAVTNAGTFATQSTLQTQTDTVMVGGVNVKEINAVTPLMGNGVTGTGSQRVTVASDNTPFPVKIDQTTPGTTNLVALAANQSVNVAQINGVTTLMGNGASGTGAQRVTIANDSTGQVALAAGTAGIGKLTANSGVTIGAVEIASAQTLATVTNVATIGTSVTPGTGASNLGKAEDAAHTTGDVGILSLAIRNDTLADQTSTDLDYGGPSVDIKGRTIVTGAPRGLKGNAQVQLSNTTTETTIIAATASKFHDVYGIILANTGASTTKVSLRDDTAGTVRAIIEVPTLETRGFMLPIDSAIAQTAVNKNWTAQCGTATTALEVTVFYVTMV